MESPKGFTYSEPFAQQKRLMVESHLMDRGITDRHTLQAMIDVPRENFVPEFLRQHAYDDNPLGIGEGQTISQPYIVALMTQAAKVGPTSKVLDVGTGSGYAAAVFSKIAQEVVTIERIELLTERAKRAIASIPETPHNIAFYVGDGSLGVPEKAPYDAIVVTAGGPEVPATLISQLAEGGRLIIPVGPLGMQQLLRVTKEHGTLRRESLLDVRFVPLIGDGGWKEGDEDEL